MKKILVCFATTFLLFACNTKKDRQTAIDDIKKYEDSIDIQHSIISVETGMHLIDLYTGFARTYRSDSLAPEYWHRAAQVAANIHRPDLSVQYLDSVLVNYADYQRIAECCFYKGFVLENVAGDIEHARLAYQEFIDKYPDDPLANDARIIVENLGLSNEEFLEKILSQNTDVQNDVAEKQ